jgi:hypothetical protein
MDAVDAKRCERAADKILDVMSDGRLTAADMMYVAMYTVMKARTPVVLDRLIEYTEQIKWERAHERKASEYEPNVIY